MKILPIKAVGEINVYNNSKFELVVTGASYVH